MRDALTTTRPTHQSSGDRAPQAIHARAVSATVATVAVAALLLLPRAAWTQPAPALPNAAMTGEAGKSPAAPPVRPTLPGKMPIVLGWVTFGVGALATLGGLEFMLFSKIDCNAISSPPGNSTAEESCGPSTNSVLFTTTAVTVSLIGLGVALYGHARRSNARYRQRSWDQRFGGDPLAWAIGSRMWASVTPTVTARPGLSATLHF